MVTETSRCHKAYFYDGDDYSRTIRIGIGESFKLFLKLTVHQKYTSSAISQFSSKRFGSFQSVLVRFLITKIGPKRDPKEAHFQFDNWDILISNIKILRNIESKDTAVIVTKKKSWLRSLPRGVFWWLIYLWVRRCKQPTKRTTLQYEMPAVPVLHILLHSDICETLPHASFRRQHCVQDLHCPLCWIKTSYSPRPHFRCFRRHIQGQECRFHSSRLRFCYPLQYCHRINPAVLNWPRRHDTVVWCRLWWIEVKIRASSPLKKMTASIRHLPYLQQSCDSVHTMTLRYGLMTLMILCLLYLLIL